MGVVAPVGNMPDLLSNPEDSSQLLTRVTRADLPPVWDTEAKRTKIGRDMNAEYDSELLCLHLRRLQSEGFVFSPAFWEFEALWRRDELRHYLGMRKLTEILFGIPESVTHERMLKRVADVSALDEFFQDEFALMLTFAFDELATYWAYVADFGFYKTLGPIFLNWIRAVARDEYNHYRNSMAVVEFAHPHRRGEMPKKLDRVVEWYLGQNGYHNHFLLDAKAVDTSPESLLKVRGNILRHFNLA